MGFQVLRRKLVQKKLSISNTAYHELNKNDPTFPKDVILGKRARGKLEHEIDAWLESTQAVRGAK